jgi:hypothetical protein
MRIAPDSVGKSFVGKSGPSNTGLSEVPDGGALVKIASAKLECGIDALI